MYSPLENRLSEVKQGVSTIATYYYDPFGRRLSKNVSGVTTYFMYADEGLIAEFNATGTPIRQYGYQPDSTWGTDPTYLKTSGQYYYYQNDHLGTPKKLTAANGATVWSAEYQAFGELQVAVASTVENPLRFAGQYADGETGLYYNFNRYYDPAIGCYVTYDPIGLGGGINPFAYVGLAPTRMIDPEGEFGGGVAGGICAMFSPNASVASVAAAAATGAIGGFFGGWGGAAASAGAAGAAAAAGAGCIVIAAATAATENIISGGTSEVVRQIAENSNRRAPGAYGAAASCVANIIIIVTRPPSRDPITGRSN